MQNAQPQNKRGTLRPRKTVFILGVLLLILLAGTLSASGWLLYKAELDDWRSNLGTLSTVLVENTAQTLSSATLVLDSIQSDIEQAGVSNASQLHTLAGSIHFSQILTEKIRGLPQISSAGVAGQDGQVVALSHAYPIPAINVSDRDYFIHHRNSPSVADFLSQAVESRENKIHTFFLSRRINDKDGRFLAVIAVGLPSEFFQKFFVSVSKDKPFAILLSRSDLKPLAWNSLVSGEEAFFSKEEGKLTSSIYDGHLEPKARFLKSAHWLSIQQKVRDYPLTIQIGITDEIYFDNWLQSMSPLIVVAATSLAGFATLFFLVLRQAKRREEDASFAIRLKEEADLTNDAKSRFLAMVSHEIRTPMSGMLGLSELLLESSLAPQQQHYAESIHSATEGLVRIINDILDLSKIESGRLDLEAVEFHPARVVRSAVELYEPSAQKKGLNFHAEIDCEDELMLVGDPARLSQVLGNLLSNAIKFTPRGSVRITMSARACQSGQWLLVFTVADSGIGISPEAHEHLFEPFRQANNSISRRFGGTGLGLAISRNLVEMMGGQIECKSIPDQSTIFTFNIRCPKAEQISVKQAIASQGSCAVDPDLPAAQIQETGNSLVAGTQILVAEDTDINQQLIRALLVRKGCTPCEVKNGQQAFDAIQGQAFDLILMDCMMPVMDGYRATSLIREYERNHRLPRVPIIALTASAIEGDRQRCLDAGMDDYLSKPFSQAALMAMLGKWLESKKP